MKDSELISHYFPALSAIQKKQFADLKALYVEWNAQINVISRKDMDAFYLHHVLHSLAIAKIISFKPETKILDVGTGGGFPGVPLAILFPECQFLLVDSIGKKIKVVDAVASSIGLSNVRTQHERVEKINERFHFVVSRAVTQIKPFWTWINNKFESHSFNDLPNGVLYLKGGDLSEELSELKRNHTLYPISDFFDEPYYQIKFVLHLPIGK